MKDKLIQSISILIELLYQQDPNVPKDNILHQLTALTAPPPTGAVAPPPTGAVAPPPTGAVAPPPTGAVAPPPAIHTMTPDATGSYEQMVAAGWTDETLIQHGMMVPPGGVIPSFMQQTAA